MPWVTKRIILGDDKHLPEKRREGAPSGVGGEFGYAHSPAGGLMVKAALKFNEPLLMGNQRKIILFTSEFPPGPGGIGNHAWNLAKALSENEIVVLTDNRAGYEDAERIFDTQQSFVVKRAGRNTGRLRGLWERCKYLLSALRRAPAGSCVLASGKFPLWLVAVVAFFFPGLKYVAVLHGSEVNFKSGWKRQLTAWALGRFDSLIAVSAYTRKLAQQLRPGVSIEVIPNGFDPSRLSGSEVEPLQGEPALITVGTVSFRKGQQNLIRALPALRRRWPELKYHIVGTPLQWDAMESIAVEKGVRDAVEIHGAVEDGRLAALLKGAQVFVMLSEELEDGDTEGFGIAILEGNAVGLPAIGSKGCGIEDAISDAYSGRLVSPHEPGEIVQALEDILANYAAYSARAKQWAQRFRWEQVIEKYEKVLGA